MLVLSRKVEESVQVGADVVVSVLSVRDGKVRLGFEGPDNVQIWRTELLEEQENSPGKCR